LLPEPRWIIVNPVDLSILIVSYNTRHLLADLFAALRRAAAGIDVQYVVVDNASSDDSVEWLRAHCPDIDLIVNDRNIGFGRANNLSVPLLKGRYVLLVNTDAFVAPDTLEKTLAYMDAHPRCGVLGVKLVGSDGALQPSCRYFPTPWNLFLTQTGLNRLFKNARLVDDMDWDHASIRQCDWVPGCYYLTRREIVGRFGLFDPRYFLYYEEVDHCRELKRAGWEVTYFPDTSVVHLGGESAKSAGPITQAGRQLAALQVESELLYFRKHHGILAVLANVLLYLLADAINLMKRYAKRQGARERISAWANSRMIWRLAFDTRLGLYPTR
jgi:GT2 family glycosyltransferase